MRSSAYAGWSTPLLGSHGSQVITGSAPVAATWAAALAGNGDWLLQATYHMTWSGLRPSAALRSCRRVRSPGTSGMDKPKVRGAGGGGSGAGLPGPAAAAGVVSP